MSRLHLWQHSSQILLDRTRLSAPMTHQLKLRKLKMHVCSAFFEPDGAGSNISRDGSARRVKKSEITNRQVYGPSRTPIPPNMPPSHQADAAKIMKVIEGSRDWRELSSIFLAVAKLPSNHMHLLAMTQALVYLLPGYRADDQELKELQSLAKELLRATRLPLDRLYTPVQVATLLRAFIDLGLFPNDNWLFASELSIMAALREEGITSSHALSMLAVVPCYQMCGHKPRSEWIQALAACAEYAWRGGSSVASVPDSVLLPTGEEIIVDPRENPSGEAQVLPLPALSLTGLSRAILTWDMPINDEWLQSYLQCLYYSLCETEEQYTRGAESAPTYESTTAAWDRQYFVFGEMSDCLWGLLLSRVRPPTEWVKAYQAASLALMRASGKAAATVSPYSCLNMMTGLAQLESPIGPDWLEALLQCAAADPRVPADLACRLLFQVGATDVELSPASQSIALVLARRVQVVLGDQEIRQRQGVHTDDEAPAPVSASNLTAEDLTFLLMGVVRCKLLPGELSGTWLETWCRGARAQSKGFIPDLVHGVLMAASEADLKLPVETIYDLLDSFMRAGAVVQARQDLQDKSLNQQDPQSSISGQQLADVLEALVFLRCPLPSTWDVPLRQLGEAKLRGLHNEVSDEQGERHLTAKLTLSLLKISCQVAAEVPSAWLTALVECLAASGGLNGKEAVVVVAKVLGEHGRLATHVMDKVDAACVTIMSQLEGYEVAQIIKTFALGGYVPSSAWWQGLRTVEGDKSKMKTDEEDEESYARSVSLRLASYCALRSVVGSEALESQGAGPWYEGMKEEACSRLAQLSGGHSGNCSSSALVSVTGEPVVASGTQKAELKDTTSKAFGLLLPGLAATQENLGLATCTAAVEATLMMPRMGGTRVITCCLDIFKAASFIPPSIWKNGAVAMVKQDLIQVQQQQQQKHETSSQITNLDVGPHEVCRLMSAIATGTLPADISGREEAGDKPSLTVQELLLQEAGRQSGNLSYEQILEILKDATSMGLVRSSVIPSALPPLMAEASASTKSAPPTASSIVVLLHSVHALGVQPPQQWIQQWTELLMQNNTTTSGHRPAVESLASDPEEMGLLVSVLDAWGTQLPPQLLVHLQATLPVLASSLPKIAVSTLHLLSNQRGWTPDNTILMLIEPTLVEAMESGMLPISMHAPLLYSMARASRPQPQRRSGSPTSQPAPQLYLPQPSSLAALVEACEAALPAYTAEHLCTSFTSLVALGAKLPPQWLDRFYDYILPLKCPLPLLTGVALATAAVKEASGQVPPTPWLEGLESIAASSADRLTTRDAAVLLSTFAKLGYKPAERLVKVFLDEALTQALQEQLRHEEQQKHEEPGTKGGQPKSFPAAAALASLLAAVHSNLQFLPSTEWCDAARPLILPLVPRINDPRYRDAVAAALASTL